MHVQGFPTVRGRSAVCAHTVFTHTGWRPGTEIQAPNLYCKVEVLFGNCNLNLTHGENVSTVHQHLLLLVLDIDVLFLVCACFIYQLHDTVVLVPARPTVVCSRFWLQLLLSSLAQTPACIDYN